MESIRAIVALDQPRESNALSVRGTERSLTVIEQGQFDDMCRQMQAYYPHQEFAEETVRGYLFDLERLAVIHGIDGLTTALLNLRIRPGQKFFPHPSEVAEELERIWETLNDQKRNKRRARERQVEIDEFWNDIVPDRMQRFGWTEEELLVRFPSMRGTKPSITGGVR